MVDIQHFSLTVDEILWTTSMKTSNLNTSNTSLTSHTTISTTNTRSTTMSRIQTTAKLQKTSNRLTTLQRASHLQGAICYTSCTTLAGAKKKTNDQVMCMSSLRNNIVLMKNNTRK